MSTESKLMPTVFWLRDIQNWKLVFYYWFYHAHEYFEWIRKFMVRW